MLGSRQQCVTQGWASPDLFSCFWQEAGQLCSRTRRVPQVREAASLQAVPAHVLRAQAWARVRHAQVGIWECLAELARTSVREPTGVWAGAGVHASPSGQGLDYVEC